jgi:hypothetical protein
MASIGQALLSGPISSGMTMHMIRCPIACMLPTVKARFGSAQRLAPARWRAAEATRRLWRQNFGRSTWGTFLKVPVRLELMTSVRMEDRPSIRIASSIVEIFRRTP